jgi:predicted MFS family arabinose efflux permease
MRFVIFLGFVSLFADITYEGARGITGPLFRHLGASAAQVGFVVGLGELFGFTLRLASGTLADRTRAYWLLTIFGYSVNAIAVPMLAFAGRWETAALLLIAERTAKSVRAPARDVLLSEAAHEVGQGWAFGLHAAMDQTGAVIGPLFMAWAVAHAGGYGPAFLYLAIPAAAALVMLMAARGVSPVDVSAPPPRDESPKLPRVFWTYVIAAGLLAAGFADFPLIAFHFESTKLVSAASIPLLYAVAMAVNGITAPAFGKLFDKFGLPVLSAGILISLMAPPLSFLGGSFFYTKAAAFAGVACWGAGMGAMDAMLRAGISRVVSMNKRGRAFGAFNAVFGVMWFAGSWTMGALYEHSLAALVALAIAAQLSAAAVFFSLRHKIRA